jgi:hypothetical protein
MFKYYLYELLLQKVKESRIHKNKCQCLNRNVSNLLSPHRLIDYPLDVLRESPHPTVKHKTAH